MKPLIVSFLVFSFAVFQLSCESSQSDNDNYSNISEVDSILIMNTIYDSMYQEVYSSKLYQVNISDINTNLIQCGIPNPQLKIIINNKHDVMINYDVNKNISEAVYEYFIKNKDTIGYYNNSPNYTIASLESLEYEIGDMIQEAEEFDLINNHSKNHLWTQLEYIKNQKKVLLALNITELKFMDPSTTISLVYPDNYSQIRTILDSIFVGIYRLRNEASLAYLNRSYISLYNEFAKTEDGFAKRRIEAINFLYPLFLYDIPYCKKHSIWHGEHNYPEIFPPPSVLQN